MHVDLTFHEPCGYRRFSDKVVPPGSERPGVYIWGFEIKERFIPYYVGKHQTSIASRIAKHVIDIKKDDSTYMRLSKAYMEEVDKVTPYYQDEFFPLITRNWSKTKLPRWFKGNMDHFKNRIIYLNNAEYMHEVGVEVSKQKDYPISLIPGASDYLKDNIHNMKVMHAECSKGGHVVADTVFYEMVEAYVKYHLKGKTVSKSLSFDELQRLQNDHGIQIQIANKSSFPQFKDEISIKFPGY